MGRRALRRRLEQSCASEVVDPYGLRPPVVHRFEGELGDSVRVSGKGRFIALFGNAAARAPPSFPQAKRRGGRRALTRFPRRCRGRFGATHTAVRGGEQGPRRKVGMTLGALRSRLEITEACDVPGAKRLRPPLVDELQGELGDAMGVDRQGRDRTLVGG